MFLDHEGVFLQASGEDKPGPVASRPNAKCKCEEYACTCSKACGCKLTGDGGDKLVSKLHPRMSAQEIMGQGRARGQKPSVVDYSFRCGCEFDVQQTVAAAGKGGSGGGEEGFGLATADGSLRCGCGEGSCECRRVCRCETLADGAAASLLQASAAESVQDTRAGDAAGWGGDPEEGAAAERGSPLPGRCRRARASLREGLGQAPLEPARMREESARSSAEAPRGDTGSDAGRGPGGNRGGRPAPGKPGADAPPPAASDLEVVLPMAGNVG